MKGPRRPPTSIAAATGARTRRGAGEVAAQELSAPCATADRGNLPADATFADVPEPDVGNYRSLFELAPDHTLTAAGVRRTRRPSHVRETRWFEEHGPDGQLVACYRAWRERSRDRPGRTHFGWERFSPKGKLLDREMRFSTRESIAALN